MTHVWETSITGLIEAAAREHGVLTRLVAPNDHHAGYTWYDQLTHVAEVRVEAKLDGTEWSWDPQKEDPRETDVPEGPVETIEVVLVGKGEKELLRLPLDFCFLNLADEVSDVDSIEVLVRRGARLKASTVCDEIMRSYFSPCEDVSSDSYTTQRENWRNKAWAKAVSVTEGDEAAHLAELENAAAALQVAQRAGETVVARVTDEGVNVEIVKGRNDKAERTRSAREGRQPRRTNP